MTLSYTIYIIVTVLKANGSNTHYNNIAVMSLSYK